ncbi:MAG: CPBP family intramembrane metalloprotease [Clostridiales bacterium]|nr:CPBP family intramembrane metalloprotease [Clostridiales bacterium]
MTKTFKLSVIFFISTLFLVVMRIAFTFINLSDNISSWLFSFAVQVIGMGVIPILLYKYWVKGDIITGFYIKTKLPIKIYLLTIIIGLLFRYMTIGVSIVFQTILRLLGYTHINSVGTIYSGWEVLLLSIITTAVLPGIFEEITDRGLLMRLFDDIKEDRTKIIYMAILFALAHQNIVQTGYTFVGGLVLSYLAVKTKSIIPGVIVHFMNNLFSVLSGYSHQKGGIISYYEDKFYAFVNSNFLVAMISFVICGFAIVLLLKYIGDSIKKDSIKEAPSQVDSVYTYTPTGSNLEPLNDLFGFSTPKKELKLRAKWHEYAFLYGAAGLGIVTTIFTFIWGLWR